MFKRQPSHVFKFSFQKTSRSRYFIPWPKTNFRTLLLLHGSHKWVTNFWRLNYMCTYHRRTSFLKTNRGSKQKCRTVFIATCTQTTIIWFICRRNRLRTKRKNRKADDGAGSFFAIISFLFTSFSVTWKSLWAHRIYRIKHENVENKKATFLATVYKISVQRSALALFLHLILQFTRLFMF